jgi:predicted phosphoribosyltransferase
MYFASRTQAGRMLASQLSEKYRSQECAVLALNDGGVVVGAQIATKLHCVINLLLNGEIMLPREPKALAGITPSGVVSYNHAYSTGELDELTGEYRGFVEQEKLKQIHELNHVVDGAGTIKKDMLRGQNVILVADGLKDGFLLDLAAEFLKPIELKKLIIAVPFASVQAVDHMHVMADDLYCLDVLAEYMDTDHYYEKHDMPDHETILKTISEIVRKWK